jgi:polar amino acid transport system ATP-binding protein
MKLEVGGLSKRYGGVAALDGVDLAVSGARVLVFVGPSGGGKSTLLRILGGLEAPDAGDCVINGSRIVQERAFLLGYRRRNGFLFQQFNLFPHFTALENIALPLEKVHGRSRGEARDEARRVLDRFGLAGHAGKHPSQLSGGQQQRVGIARAVACRPDLLFLDEPTSALDPEMSSEVLGLVQELAEQGQDIILSTHEMGFARKVADRIVYLSGGKVGTVCGPEGFFAEPPTEEIARFLSKVMRY